MAGITISQLPLLTSVTASDNNILFLASDDNSNHTSVAISLGTIYNSFYNLTTVQSTAAFNKANSAYTLANSALNLANTDSTFANSAFNQANTATLLANSAFNQANLAFNLANTDNNLANSAYNQANTATLLAANAQFSITQANTYLQANDTFNLSLSKAYTDTANAYLFGILSYAGSVNNTQNTLITSANTLAQSAVTLATSASSNTVYLQGALNSANANVVYLNTVNSTQNTNITNLGTFLSSNISYLQGGLNTANANIQYILTVNNNQNTGISTATTLAQNAYDSSNTRLSTSGGTVSGNVTINGALTVTGNVTYTGNVNSLQISGNTGQFFGNNTTGFSALYAGVSTGYTIEPQTLVQVTGNFAGYTQLNQQNISNNANASSDFVCTADNGTANDTFIDVGINSSTYNQSGFTLSLPNDGYVYVQGNTATGGGNLILATMNNNDVIFATGGQNTSNEQGRWKNGTGLLIKQTTAATNTTSGALQVSGGVGISGNLYSSSAYVTSTTPSTSNTTGALVVSGGVGVTGNINSTGALSVFSGLYSTGAYTGAYTDGIVADYTTGNGRISVGPNDSLTFYNGGVGANTILTIGATGTISVANNLTVNGVTTLTQTQELLTSLTGATGTVTHNCSTGQIFVHSSIAANFTVNLTNLNAVSNTATSVTLILNQGATPYIPNALQIAASGQTINWQGGSAPSGNANKKDVVSFSILNVSGTYTVFGQLTTYG